jgi:integrase/recombinase XerD
MSALMSSSWWEKFEKPTVKQHLAAIKMLFDWLVVGQVIAINPAHAVRGRKHVVKRGKTPVMTADQDHELLNSIDVTTVVGLRDRALIALMAYSFARVSAAVSMRVEDYFVQGKRWWVRLHEKGGRVHEIPLPPQFGGLSRRLSSRGRHDGSEEDSLVSFGVRSHRELTGSAMHRIDAWRMIRGRCVAAGFNADICCHTFRATGITAYLDNNGILENAQVMAAHESPRTSTIGRATK